MVIASRWSGHFGEEGGAESPFYVTVDGRREHLSPGARASELALASLADTIKALSDQLPNATIVLIGVADDVEQLVAEHQSIERALVQIHMPRMSTDELSEIIVNGLTGARVRIDADALKIDHAGIHERLAKSDEVVQGAP